MKAMKIVALLGVAALLTSLSACGGGGKYGELKTVLEKQVVLFEEYGNAMDKATSGKEVAVAMNKFSDGMKELVPQMKAMSEKFKDMEAIAKEPPAELKDVMKKYEAVMGKVMTASMKAAQFMQDPEVQEAQKKFGEAMSGLK